MNHIGPKISVACMCMPSIVSTKPMLYYVFSPTGAQSQTIIYIVLVVVIGIVKYQLAIMTNQQREISNKKLPHVFIYVSTICIYIIYIYIPQKTLRCISAGLYAKTIDL